MKENKLEILLVEDNPADIELTLLAFKKYKVIESCEIHLAKDGKEALEYIFGTVDADGVMLSHRPGLILLDLKLPIINGIDVLKKIKSHITAKEIPVVVLTGSDNKKDQDDAYSLGADSYLCKSGSLGQFVQAASCAIQNATKQDISFSYQ
jgi:CheY-like chemotaxis protein